MKLDADGYTWRLGKKLAPGRHSYKFVLNGEQWIIDPKAWKNEGDGNGNTNSILLVTPPDFAKPASSSDGVLARSAIFHSQRPPALNFDRGELSLTFTLRPGDARKVELIANNRSHAMPVSHADELTETRKVKLAWNRRSNLSYFFRITDGSAVFDYGSNGLSPRGQSRAFRIQADSFQPFTVPDWVEGRVFYQIFPERFRNGDPGNDPQDVVPWDGEPKYFNFMGGDLKGGEQKIGYLDSLGVGAVYFNPIFESPSNHGYETINYRKVEPRFGTNAQFASLTKQLQAKNIKVVLDGVFNHTAVTFAPFADMREKGRDSKYKDWFYIKSFPVEVKENPNYEAWFGFPSMPKLNVGNPEVKSHLLDVVDFWDTTAGIDGWRLDVANEVDMNFWRAFRTRVKKVNPEGWILGEVWGDGRPWLGGDQWDSIMGYQFRDATLGFVARGETKPSVYLDRLFATYESYPPQVSRSLMNLLSSHDTPRFLSECGGNADLALLGAALQMTWPGSPSIYYGEELGMEGKADPDNRRGMRWDLEKADNRFLKEYRALIAARNKHAALTQGEPVRLESNDSDSTLAFGRLYQNQAALVAVNRSTAARTIEVKLPAAWPNWSKTRLHDALGKGSVARPKPGIVRVVLPPLSAAIVVPEKRS